MKRFELDEKPEQPKLKQSIFSRLKRKFSKTTTPMPILTAQPVIEQPKPPEQPKPQLKISREAVPTKTQLPLKTPKKRDWRVAINMVIGGGALMAAVYGAIVINQAFTPNTTIVSSILMVSIGVSIIINIIRGS